MCTLESKEKEKGEKPSKRTAWPGQWLRGLGLHEAGGSSQQAVLWQRRERGEEREVAGPQC